MNSSTASSVSTSTRQPAVRSMEELQLVQEDLERDGFAAVRVIEDEDELNRLRSGFWDWLEGSGSGVRRDNPSTWDVKRWPKSFHGIIHGFGITHVQFLWDLRENENAYRVFSYLWETDQLLVSFDGACLSMYILDVSPTLLARY